MKKFLAYYKEVITEFIYDDRAIYLLTTLINILVIEGIVVTIVNGFIDAVMVTLLTLITILGLIFVFTPISMFIAESIIEYRDNKIKKKEPKVFDIEELL